MQVTEALVAQLARGKTLDRIPRPFTDSGSIPPEGELKRISLVWADLAEP